MIRENAVNLVRIARQGQPSIEPQVAKSGSDIILFLLFSPCGELPDACLVSTDIKVRLYLPMCE